MSKPLRLVIAAGAAALVALPVGQVTVHANTGTISQTIAHDNKGSVKKSAGPITQTIGTIGATDNSGKVTESTGPILQEIGGAAGSNENKGTIDDSTGVGTIVGSSNPGMLDQRIGQGGDFFATGLHVSAGGASDNTATMKNNLGLSGGCFGGLACGQAIEGGNDNELSSNGPNIAQAVVGFFGPRANDNELTASGSSIVQVVSNATTLTPTSPSDFGTLASHNELEAKGSIISQFVLDGSHNDLQAKGVYISEEVTGSDNKLNVKASGVDVTITGNSNNVKITASGVTTDIACTGCTVTIDDASGVPATITANFNN